MNCRTVSPAVLLLIAAALPAQIVVNPTGGGAYTELQAAIDAAPPGAVIRVIGGSYSSLTISKSLTIIGDPAPTISSPTQGLESIQPPAVTLVGSGSDTLTLSNVVIEGRVSEFFRRSAGPGIGGSGFSELRVLHSVVKGHEWLSIDPKQGAPAIISDTDLLVVVDSDVRASASLGNFSVPNGSSWDGVPAIAGQTVIVIDSTVVGGEGGSAYFFSVPSSTPCPCPSTIFHPPPHSSAGGAGISASDVFVSGSTVSGGLGGQVYYYNPSPLPYGLHQTPWGRQPPGPAFVANQVHDLNQDLSNLTKLALGQRWNLSIRSTRGSAAVMLMGGLSSAPIPLGMEWAFVDPMNFYLALGIPAGTTQLGFPIPSAQFLAGAEIAVQTYSLSLGLSGPHFDIVGF